MEDVRIVYPVSKSYLSPNEYTAGVKLVRLLPLSTFSSIWDPGREVI